MASAHTLHGLPFLHRQLDEKEPPDRVQPWASAPIPCRRSRGRRPFVPVGGPRAAVFVVLSRHAEPEGPNSAGHQAHTFC